jgi:hypothetical protein
MHTEETAMEAEHINAINDQLDDLIKRVASLRGYL